MIWHVIILLVYALDAFRYLVCFLKDRKALLSGQREFRNWSSLTTLASLQRQRPPFPGVAVDPASVRKPRMQIIFLSRMESNGYSCLLLSHIISISSQRCRHVSSQYLIIWLDHIPNMGLEFFRDSFITCFTLRIKQGPEEVWWMN